MHVALVRAGVPFADAKRMTYTEGAAWLRAYGQQEQESYERARHAADE